MRRLVAMLVVAVAAIFLSAPAYAHDHERADLDEWFKALKNSQGTPCCDDTEAKHVANVDWQAACEKGTGECHYQVFLVKRWWNVPDDAVLKSPNLDGKTLVWPLYYWIDGKPENGISSVFIRCFMPGAGG
jgi:hypothetical protein